MFKRYKIRVVCLFSIAILGSTCMGAVSFPDYFPLDVASHGIKTFTWTYGNSGEYISQVGSTESAPYTSGSIDGTYITNWSDWGDTLLANDGTSVKILGNTTQYVSTDSSLTSHPSSWSFGDVGDGLVVDQRGIYFVSKDLSSSDYDDTQLLFFELQDITVLNGTYSDAVVIWYLDTDYSYVAPNFQGTDTSLGLSVSSDITTLGYSITAFDMYGYATGIIGHGDIAAETGSLLDLAQLSDVSRDPAAVPAPSALLLAGLGAGAVGWLRCRRNF